MSLELAEGDVDVSVDDSAELFGARAGRPSRQRGLDGFRRGAVADPGLVAGSCECSMERSAAMSISVRGTVVTGLPRNVVPSRALRE